MRKLLKVVVIAACMGFASATHAFFFIFPIPSISKPRQLQALIDALEKSTETRALAYVSEDRTFGSKVWVWGHKAGALTQEDADQQALQACNANLARASSQMAGGKPLYNFGAKICELYAFSTNGAPSAVVPTPSPVSAPSPVEVVPTVTNLPPIDKSEDVKNGTAVPPVAAPVEFVRPERTNAKRLEDLNDLRTKGLVTEEEYRLKRKEIMESL